MATATNSLLLFTHNPKLSISCIKHLNIFRSSASFFSIPTPLQPLQLSANRLQWPVRCSAVEAIPLAVQSNESSPLEENEEGIDVEDEEKRRKVYVANLPWNFSAPEISNLFSQCGTVKDVEVIKQNGKSRGFTFVTMASGEEARAAVEKLDSFEVGGRIIRVEFAKSFRKPSSGKLSPTAETCCKIYVSNLAWKVRANNLRAFFSEKFNPVSARVVFDSTTGKAAGYGFVSFPTLEEAEAAITELDGKELMGRPLRLKISQRSSEAAGEQESETDDSEEQDQES